MKPLIAVVLFALSFALGPDVYCQSNDKPPKDIWRVDAEIGHQVFPVDFNDLFGYANWMHKFTVRLGVGRPIQSHLLATVFAEYRRYGSNTRYGELEPWLSPRSYSRSEFACYGTITAYGFLEVGVGAIYQSHEGIQYYREVYSMPISSNWDQPAAYRIRLYYIVGLKYEIPLGRGFYIPLGLSMDTFLGEHDVQNPTIKVGLVKEFN